jgi:uncharacterized membrane protein YdjX (TVP38/TMEM64 family)
MGLWDIALSFAETTETLGPVWGPLFYVFFLAVWVVLCLPCSPLEPLPGFLFGLKMGTLCSLAGKSLGSGAALLLGRYVCKRPTERFVVRCL